MYKKPVLNCFLLSNDRAKHDIFCEKIDRILDSAKNITFLLQEKETLLIEKSNGRIDKLNVFVTGCLGGIFTVLPFMVGNDEMGNNAVFQGVSVLLSIVFLSGFFYSVIRNFKYNQLVKRWFKKGE